MNWRMLVWIGDPDSYLLHVSFVKGRVLFPFRRKSSRTEIVFDATTFPTPSLKTTGLLPLVDKVWIKNQKR